MRLTLAGSTLLVVLLGAGLVGASGCNQEESPAPSAESEVNSRAFSCPVELSAMAKKSVSSLEARFCADTQKGEPHANPFASTDAQKERDTIFQLLAFAVVDKGWDERRGHPIGAVIVIGDRVEKIGLNSNFAEVSAVEHAETRAIRGFFADKKAAGAKESPSSMLENATIYSSLEPCQMCAGTLNMAKIRRVVYGVKDNRFGDALAYLHAFPYHADFEQHDSTPESKAFTDAINADPNASLARLLEGMRPTFHQATEDLASFQVKFPENAAALNNARAALETL
jgi:tRNA(Arg) A34 adenosine deaminase TadA